jgi:hypothetical protein
MAGYIGVKPVPEATQFRDIITATAGQTTFVTQGYSVSYLDVYLNGIHLTDGIDYTADDGQTIELVNPAEDGYVLEYVAQANFTIAVEYPVGMTYTQLPGKPNPSNLGLPGTWTNISSEFAGDFFRVEGGNASTFESGRQGDATARPNTNFSTNTTGSHGHSQTILTSSAGNPSKNSTQGYGHHYAGTWGYAWFHSTSNNGNHSHSVNGGGDSETRPVNRTIRVWERTA